MKIEQKFIENFIIDCTKEKIDRFERAIIIKNYLKEHNFSIRAFASKFNVSKSTVEDWLLWNKIKRQQYSKMISDGYTHTQVYRGLRDNKDQKEVTNIKVGDFSKDIDICTKRLGKYCKWSYHSEETIKKIKELRDVLNRIEMKAERTMNMSR